ncbi:hypothetical protein [Microbacterium sp. E-13]|uniref:hypothetical protein n=1 Tax=Microbacterium sp. E-13 TaxID=3404048 RepID=UPI003CEB7CC0
MVVLLHREGAYEKDSPRAGEADLIVAKHRSVPQTHHASTPSAEPIGAEQANHPADEFDGCLQEVTDHLWSVLTLGPPAMSLVVEFPPARATGTAER